jgi:hypothetical protein
LAGQAEIENDEIRSITLHLLYNTIAASGARHPKTVGLEIAADQFGKPHIVLYQDD